MDLLKMYSLLKNGDFSACHVSLLEGKKIQTFIIVFHVTLPETNIFALESGLGLFSGAKTC